MRPSAHVLAGLLAAGALAATGGCGDGDGNSPRSAASVELIPLFRVDSLHHPESVAWDSARSRYLITNVHGEADVADGNGYILPVGRDGRATEDGRLGPDSPGLRLDAPKGIALVGNRAYVADIHRVVAIDLSADTLLYSLGIGESEFLNDVAPGPDGSLYVTDTQLDAVFRVSPRGGGYERLPAAGSLRGPNGVIPDPENGGLLLAGWEGAVVRLDLDGSVVLVAEPRGAGRLDGIQADGRGGVVYSDYPRGAVERLAGTKPGGWERPEAWLDGLETPADLLLRDSVLAVPELDADRVRFYRVRWKEPG